jgi:hypothetical protein
VLLLLLAKGERGLDIEREEKEKESRGSEIEASESE